MKELPRKGDCHRCTLCGMELQITRGWYGGDPNPLCTEFMCCGVRMKYVVPPVDRQHELAMQAAFARV